jgi:hypothetical protein
LMVTMCSGSLMALADKDLAIFFSNFGTAKVHAIFVAEEDAAKVFEAGGWTKKSVDMTFKLMKTILPPLVEGVVLVTTGIPGTSIVTGAGLHIAQHILGDFPTVITSAITLQTIRDLDWFKQVFPQSSRYSYYPDPKSIQHGVTAFQTHFKKPGTKGAKNIVLMVFADKNGIIDFSRLEYIGNFNHATFNAVQYGPEPGRVIYYHKDPETGATGASKEVGIFIPVDLDNDGNVDYTPEGQSELDRLLDLQKLDLQKKKGK